MTDDRFAQDNIFAFAAAWFRALDEHAPSEELEQLVAGEGLQMIFPEKTLEGIEDFKSWYAGGSYHDGSEAPGVINIFFDENHTLLSATAQPDGDAVVVDVVVAWQASWFEPPAAKSKRTSMNATQRWRVRRSSRNRFGLEIVSYDAMAKPFAYAPGFATL